MQLDPLRAIPPPHHARGNAPVAVAVAVAAPHTSHDSRYAQYGFDEAGGHYRLFTDILANETRAQGGEPVFLMTWRDGGPDDLTPELQGEVQ